MKPILSIVFIILFSIPQFSLAKSKTEQRYESVVANIMVNKTVAENENDSLYTFYFCAPGAAMEECDVLGSPSGYTIKQIKKLPGRWKQLGAYAMGAGEAVVVLYVGVSAGIITAGSMAASELAVITGFGVAGGTMVGLPAVSWKTVNGLNPFYVNRSGKVQHLVISAVKDLYNDDELNLVIFKSTDVDEVLEKAELIEESLLSLD